MDILEAHRAGLLNLAQQEEAANKASKNQLAMMMAIPGIANAFKEKFGAKQPAATALNQPLNPITNLPEVTPETVTNAPLPQGNLTVNQIMEAIGKLESRGNYSATGPKTKSGDVALGKYQVMRSNIPSWSRAALGYEVTPDQFLNNPELQDKIAQYQMGKYYNKYGNPDDVAAMWFSGRPSRNNVRKDIIGTSVPQYIAGVRRYL